MHERPRNSKTLTPRCAPNATFFGPSSMHCTLPTSNLAGRHPELLSRTTNDYIAKDHFMTPDLNSRPRLAAGCRLNDAKHQPRVLLMPQKVESDIVGYLSLLNDQRALDFVDGPAGGGSS